MIPGRVMRRGMGNFYTLSLEHIHHIYKLTSIVRNRLGMEQTTFVAFIDF